MTDKILSKQTEKNVQIAVLATLFLLGIYFIAQFYWNVMRFIEIWAPDEFVSFFAALFNLTALLIVGAVSLYQLRRLREREVKWEGEEGAETEAEAEEQEESGEESQAPDELTDIDGVYETNIEALRGEGYETVEDLREATQDEIAETEEVGEALAARIRADVGGVEVEDEVEGAEETEKAEEGETDASDAEAEEETEEDEDDVPWKQYGDVDPDDN